MRMNELQLEERKPVSYLQSVVDLSTTISVITVVKMLWTHSDNKSTDNAEPLSICFLPQYSVPKKVLFQSVTKIMTQRKSKRCL